MCMAEGSMSPGMTENDITTLTEALHAQQQLLQKLYAELDQEREASASAASEALSMILRLQGEKAATKMEASQYKRMTEEKLCHAEESLAIFEDVIYQKEMEIASLECQIQAYRCKFLSLGCSDLASDNLLLPGSDLFKGETNFSSSTIRRLQSLPQIDLKDFHNNIDFIEQEKPITPMPDLFSKKVEQKADQEANTHQHLNVEKRSGNSSGGSFNFYWEQIKRLDEQVKEISYSKDSCNDGSTILRSGFRTCSLPSPMSIGTYEPVEKETFARLDQVKENEILPEGEATIATPSSLGVHDVFEVPKIDETPKTYEHQDKEQSKLTDGLCFNDETDCVKNTLHYTVHENKISKPRDENVVGCSVALARTITDINESQAKFQVLNERVGRLEKQRNNTRQEISHAGEEVKLLKEIQGQLNLIQAEMYSWRTKKAPPQEEISLHSLMEAMIHFWL